jgi:hypothetical protein
MAKVEIEITFRVKSEQAAALLEFLSCVLRADIMRALDSPEQVRAFDFASERLRVALRKVVEPAVEPNEEPDEEPDSASQKREPAGDGGGEDCQHERGAPVARQSNWATLRN